MCVSSISCFYEVLCLVVFCVCNVINKYNVDFFDELVYAAMIHVPESKDISFNV